MKRHLICAGLAAALAVTPLAMWISAGPAAASEIRYVVNNVPVTSYDIQRRAAFLRLQRRSGDLNKLAAEEMVNQTLRNQEVKRLNIRVTDDQVDQAYARFAKSNNMPMQALDQALSQSGVTKQHFKEFIRSQMGWGQAIGAKGRGGQGSGAGGAFSERDIVRRMLEKGGSKPSATEYMLQQIIFVVPPSERGSMAKRKREAEAMRARFAGCNRTREFAKGLLDVTVIDRGRVLALELPADWADAVKSTKVGGATAVRETERGVEFIGICSTREVSDDRVARMVFQNEATAESNPDSETASKKYTEELRAKAKITQR